MTAEQDKRSRETFNLKRWYRRDDGAEVRVEFVKNCQVYYVSWMPDEEDGSARRMDVELFRELLTEQKMVGRDDR